MVIHLTVKTLRFTSEVFTSTQIQNKVAFTAIVDALKAKNFKVEVKEFPYTETIALTVPGLKSDKAVTYARDIIVRAGRKAGFAFLSTEYK